MAVSLQKCSAICAEGVSARMAGRVWRGTDPEADGANAKREWRGDVLFLTLAHGEAVPGAVGKMFAGPNRNGQ